MTNKTFTPEVYHPLDIKSLTHEEQVSVINYIVLHGEDSSYTIYLQRDGKTYCACGVTLQKIIGL